MSSSPRPARVSLQTPDAAELVPQASAFRYREVLSGTADNTCGPNDAGSPHDSAAREAQAREEGRQQGERDALAKFSEQINRERAAITAALADFARQRAGYYRKVEQEVVQLSLSIARKILHREAQLDPQLLMGIVRVALDNIENTSSVTVAVAPQQAEEWRKYLAANLEGAHVPAVVGDPALGKEQCELRTAMGNAQVGIDVHFKEIEQGLMDFLAARPKEKA